MRAMVLCALASWAVVMTAALVVGPWPVAILIAAGWVWLYIEALG